MAIQWSAQQQSIFGWFRSGSGNLVVRARAGTGKTTTIVEGVALAPESKILLAAFNKRIAIELAAKVKNPRCEVKTLHALGFSFVRREWPNVKMDADRGDMLARTACAARMADSEAKSIELEQDRKVGADEWASIRNRLAPMVPSDVLTCVAKLAALCKSIYPLGASHEDIVTLAQDFDCVPDEERAVDGWEVNRVAFCAANAVTAACHNDGVIDFNDMIFLPLALNLCRAWFDMVVVDEAQDMNPAQLLLAQRALKSNGRICVVGDDRQAIYSFRGADSQALDNLKREYSAQEMGLTITRRCPTTVVAAAQVIVPDFESAPDAPTGEIVTSTSEAMIGSVVEGDAILSRKNAPLASTCLRILRTGKRAKIEGRDIAKGLVALVKRLAKGRALDGMKDFLGRLAAWETKQADRWTAAEQPAKAAEMHDTAETIRVISDGLTGVPELCARIESLFADSASDLPCVVLSSIHRAKGLEWSKVYVLADTLYLKFGNPVEESNLAYVAITRTKSTLVMVDGVAPSPALSVAEPVQAPIVAPKALPTPAAPQALVSAAELHHALTEDATRIRALTVNGAEPIHPARYVTVTAQDFAELLLPHGFTQDHAATLKTGQRVLVRHLSGGEVLLVYTTVPNGESTARDAGEDSIKVAILGTSGKPLMKRQPYACRTRGWRETLVARISVALDAARGIPDSV